MFRDTKSQLDGIRQIFAEAKQQDNWNLEEPMLFSYYRGRRRGQADALGVTRRTSYILSRF